MRERILDAAQQLVQDRGLNAVSFQDLANAVGLKKPSLFHHFANKEALVAALLGRCRTSYATRYADVIAQDVSAPEKLRALSALFEAGLREDQPCLLAALGSSIETLSTSLRSDLQKTAQLSVDRYTSVFQQGRDEGTLRFVGSPGDAAMAFLGMLQGLQILARAEGKTNAFRSAAGAFIDSISVQQ